MGGSSRMWCNRVVVFEPAVIRVVGEMVVLEDVEVLADVRQTAQPWKRVICT